MKITLSLIAVLFISTSSMFAQLGANLLTNPGAESGSIAGWTAGGDATPRADNGSFDAGISPHTGMFDFVGGTGALGTLSQTVSLASISSALIDAGNALATFGFWEQGLNQGTPSDDGSISIVFLDASNGVLGMFTSPEVDSHDGIWTQYSSMMAVPAGTRSITYTMNFIRHSGTDNDSFIDDNSLSISAVPEPMTWSMFAAGAALLLGVRRLRRLA